MPLTDESLLFKQKDVTRFNKSRHPITRAIEHALFETSKTLSKKIKDDDTLLIFRLLELNDEKRLHDSSTYIPPKVSYLYERFSVSKGNQKEKLINSFVKVYEGIFPLLHAKRYTPYEMVHMVRELIKDITMDEPKFIEGMWINDLLDWLTLIIAMEYGYSSDYAALRSDSNIFDMTLEHREYWLYELTGKLYPAIKDRIKLTPNLEYVFEYDRYADHVEELHAIFDSIAFEEREKEIKLPSGGVIRPIDYMLKKTKKTADANFFLREIMERFAYINHHTIEKGDYYLMAPPLVQYLKFERSSSHWQGSHQHIFHDPEEETIRFKIVHIGERYYAQRLIGTPLCDHCSRIYPLTPKHTLHIKDLEYPTVEDLKTIHENNLAFDMYRGL